MIALAALITALGVVIDTRTNYFPADSAAVARQAYREARGALAAGDSVTARARMARAHAAWPDQWVYAYGLASLAAAAGDSAQAVRALDDLARTGAGPELARDSALAGLAARSPGVEAGLARVAANRAPIPKSDLAVAFAPADSEFWPEGLARDPRDGALFVASVRQRKVAIVEPRNPPRDFVKPGEGGLDAALAVAVDPARDLVWVTSAALPQMEGYTAADSGRAAIDAFSRTTGKRVAHHPLPPAPEGHVPGDALVAPGGDVYVTDSAHPAIYLVRAGLPDGAPATEWLADPSFRSLQGQALSINGRVLYVADYAHGLMAIQRATKEVAWLRPPRGINLLGLDGMARYGHDLVAVQNGVDPPRIVRIGIEDTATDALGNSTRYVSGLEVLDRRLPLADEPTMGVVDGDWFVYVANSQWEKYDDGGRRKPGARVTQPVLLKVSLKPHSP